MAEVAVVGKVRARGQDEDADGDGTAPPPAKVAKVDDDGENAASGDPDVDPDADAADDGDDGAPTRRSLRSRNPPRPRRGGKGANENGAPSSNGKADGAANTKEEEAAVLFPGVEYDGESPGGRAALVAWLRKKTSVGSLTEVHVAGAALGRAVHSRPVRSRQLWGTQVYTDDSDLVAVLIHLGFLNPALLDAVASDVVSTRPSHAPSSRFERRPTPRCSAPKFALTRHPIVAFFLRPPPLPLSDPARRDDGAAAHKRRLEVVLKTLPGQATYPSTHANGMRSRCWRVPPMAHEAARRSFTVKSCTAVVPSGSGQQGPSAPAGGRKDAAAARPPASDDAETRLTLWPAPGLFAIPNPTVVPSAAEKVVNTRSSAASAERKSKFLQEVTLQYNLCNEPWLKYVTSAVSDQGLEPSEWTSARMVSPPPLLLLLLLLLLLPPFLPLLPRHSCVCSHLY